MSFGKYKLKSPGVNKSLAKAAARAKKLNGKVIIVQEADPDKLAEYRAKQRKKRIDGKQVEQAVKKEKND